MEEAKYLNRELSWLDFNARVLQEANDKDNPLLERFNYLGIFSNNRDEFFRVRIATLNRMRDHKKAKEEVKRKLTKILLDVQEKVAQQEELYTETYQSLIQEAKEKNIFLINEKELNKGQKIFVHQYFKDQVRQHIFPIMLGDSMKYKNFKDHSVYLSVEMLDSSKKFPNRYALIELPTNELPRFIQLPETNQRKYLIFLEDVVRFNLQEIFSILGYNEFNAYLVKLTREAELDIDNDVLKSFLEIMTESVKKRKKAAPIRFVYDKNISPPLLKSVLNALGIRSDDKLRAGGRYHNLKDFIQFPVHDPKHLYQALKPLSHPDLPNHISKFEILKKKDILIHYPYHSFQSLSSFMWEAAIDPSVKEIKMTFYRVSRHSTIMKALINAARNGKLVTVFMELQARFDEEDNIYWTEKLQEEGVKIIPNIPGFKVHSKLILIRRKEEGNNVYYSNIGTGNFHEATARVYSDTSLLTSNPVICKDVNNIFYLFEAKFKLPTFKELKVAPFKIRSFLYKKIEKEIENAQNGFSAWMIIKVNNLVDETVIEKIYQAADAGVQVQLIVRGICVLKENITHKNITAMGVVDRYLEHSRVFIFANNSNPLYYISSADLMPRNLDYRIEVICPIHAPALKQEIYDLIHIQLKDNVKARNLQGSTINSYKKNKYTEVHQSQIETYQYLKQKGIKA